MSPRVRIPLSPLESLVQNPLSPGYARLVRNISNKCFKLTLDPPKEIIRQKIKARSLIDSAQVSYITSYQQSEYIECLLWRTG